MNLIHLEVNEGFYNNTSQSASKGAKRLLSSKVLNKNFKDRTHNIMKSISGLEDMVRPPKVADEDTEDGTTTI